MSKSEESIPVSSTMNCQEIKIIVKPYKENVKIIVVREHNEFPVYQHPILPAKTVLTCPYFCKSEPVGASK